MGPAPHPPEPEPEVAVAAIAPVSLPNGREPDRQDFKSRFQKLSAEMLLEACGTGFAICIIAGAHALLGLLIGKDARFFDFIPIAWVFDAGHIALVGRLVWRIIRSFND